MKTTIIKIMLITAVFIFMPKSHAMAGVIFEENFDSQPDFKSLKAYAHGLPCVAKVTATACTVPNWNSFTVDEIWTPDDDVFPIMGSRPGIEISNLNHYGTAGKAITFTNEQTTGSSNDGWGSDTTLLKVLPAHYPELYFQFRIKYEPNFPWRFDANNSHSIKTFRFFNWDGTGAAPPNSWSNSKSPSISPANYVDIGQGFYNYGIANNFRCSPFTTNVMCSATPNANTVHYHSTTGLFKSTDTTHKIYNVSGLSSNGMSQTLADGNWHKVTLHAKMNTFTGAVPNQDGVMEIAYDDVVVWSFSDIVWANSGSTVADLSGWNEIVIGGNNYTSFPEKPSGSISVQRAGGRDTHSAIYEASYAIDDIVVSTTPIPAGYVIKGATLPSGQLRGNPVK